MYVSKPSACHGKRNLNAQTYTLNFHSKTEQHSTQEALHYVCMFENPLPVMENETYTLENELKNQNQTILNQRKRYPYRGIVVCIFVYV